MPHQYQKQPLSSPALLALLRSRNLLIPDEARALRYLDTIGYYRLSGYMYPLQVPGKSHRFRDGISFTDVVQAYKFDKQLRALVMEYMERIEVVLRAKLTNYYSLEYGFFWYADDRLIDRQYKGQWEELLTNLKKDFVLPKELFLRIYKRNYPDEPLPPSQMALETLSLGELARLFRALTTDEVKRRIAAEFNVAPITLEGWFIWLTNVRNVCAHHGRLWNRIMPVDRPSMPSRKEYKFAVTMPPDANTTMYGAIAIMHRLLKSFNPGNSFAANIEALIQRYQIDATQMGFPVEWAKEAVWHFE